MIAKRIMALWAGWIIGCSIGALVGLPFVPTVLMGTIFAAAALGMWLSVGETP